MIQKTRKIPGGKSKREERNSIPFHRIAATFLLALVAPFYIQILLITWVQFLAGLIMTVTDVPSAEIGPPIVAHHRFINSAQSRIYVWVFSDGLQRKSIKRARCVYFLQKDNKFC
jgi:hypothetical protein